MGRDKYRIGGIYSSGYHHGVDGNPHFFLKNLGWKSIVLANEYFDDGTAIGRDIYFYKKNNIKNVFLSISLIKKIFNKLYQPFLWASFNHWCKNILKQNNIQLIHAHFGYTGVRISPLVKKMKLPLVVTFYGVDGSQLLKDITWVKKYQEMFLYADKCIVLCEEVKNRLMNIGCPEEKILIWQIPIELNTYQYSPRFPKEIIRFIIGARFVEKKGYNYLLKAFKKLIDSGRKVELTIIGYGEKKQLIIDKIDQEGLQNHVTLINTALQPGFPEFFNKVLKEHDIFVLPSTTSEEGDDEGGPSLTLVAAQAAGLPVICTNFPGSEITVFDGENGLFCLANDVDSLYEKMILMMDNPDWWNRMGKAGSDHVHALFTKERQFPILADLFQSIIEKHTLS